MAYDSQVIVRRDRNGNIIRIIHVYRPASVLPTAAQTSTRPIVEQQPVEKLQQLLREMETQHAQKQKK